MIFLAFQRLFIWVTEAIPVIVQARGRLIQINKRKKGATLKSSAKLPPEVLGVRAESPSDGKTASEKPAVEEAILNSSKKQPLK